MFGPYSIMHLTCTSSRAITHKRSDLQYEIFIQKTPTKNKKKTYWYSSQWFIHLVTNLTSHLFKSKLMRLLTLWVDGIAQIRIPKILLHYPDKQIDMYTQISYVQWYIAWNSLKKSKKWAHPTKSVLTVTSVSCY